MIRCQRSPFLRRGYTLPPICQWPVTGANAVWRIAVRQVGGRGRPRERHWLGIDGSRLLALPCLRPDRRRGPLSENASASATWAGEQHCAHRPPTAAALPLCIKSLPESWPLAPPSRSRAQRIHSSLGWVRAPSPQVVGETPLWGTTGSGGANRRQGVAVNGGWGPRLRSISSESCSFIETPAGCDRRSQGCVQSLIHSLRSSSCDGAAALKDGSSQMALWLQLISHCPQLAQRS